jgi:AcrR family transcriptional regulator
MEERRTQARGDARREEILEVALKIFAESGYYGASIAEIADGVGISQPGLLHHFKSKRALLAAVLEYRDRTQSERMVLSSVGPLRGIEALRHQVRMVERNATHRGLVQLFVVVTAEAVNPDHPAHKWLLERYEWMVAWLEKNLRLGIDDGTIRPDVDCRAVAREVFAIPMR